MKIKYKYENLLSDNKRMTKKLIELNTKLDICQQKYLSIESALEVSLKLVQHLKTENQLLRTSTPDVFPLTNSSGPPILAITDGLEVGEINPLNQMQSEDNNPTSDLCKSDLIVVQYENEIKELRSDCDLLDCLPIHSCVVPNQEMRNAMSHLSSNEESECESDHHMDIDLDEMSPKGVSENTEQQIDLKCKYCGKRFPEVTVLNEHKLLHNSSDGQQIRCAEDFCGHQFDSKHDLKRHLKAIHRSGHKNNKFSSLKAKFVMNSTQNKQHFVCNDCKQEFTNIQSFRLHQKSVHNIVSTFKCKFSGCDLKFEKSSELRAHEENHRKQKSIIEFKPSPNKTPVLSEANGSHPLQSTPKPIPKRQFACVVEGCNSSYVHKTSLKKHEEKYHPIDIKSVIDLTQIETTQSLAVVAPEGMAPTVVAPAVVAPAEDMTTKLRLLNLFFSEQQKNTLI